MINVPDYDNATTGSNFVLVHVFILYWKEVKYHAVTLVHA